MSDVIAIIPARGGSKGVPHKNIIELNGHPLLAYSIAAAKLAGVERVLISTDSEEYAEIAKHYGAEVPFLRPDELSNDQSSDYDFMRHAMEWVRANEGIEPEYWLHIRPTTPLRDPVVLKQAIKTIKNDPNATSVRSGHEAPESPFKWLMKDEKGYFIGLRKDLTSEKVNLPRQSFPHVYVPNGYIDIARISHVLKSETLHGNRMIVFETPPIDEIDTKEDLEYVKFKIKNNPSLLTEFFSNNK
jgi:N-acylneuraminate cytidylyltransferase